MGIQAAKAGTGWAAHGAMTLVADWNGALLDSLDAVIQYACTMTWKGKHPLVSLVTTVYQTGVTLTKQAMQAVEAQLQRLPHLDKWFVDIVYPSPAIGDS